MYSDAGNWRGELPVTLILPNPEDVAPSPFREAPSDWVEVGR